MCTWPLLRLEESKMYWWLPAWFKIYVPYEVTCYFITKILALLPGCISRVLCVVVWKKRPVCSGEIALGRAGAKVWQCKSRVRSSRESFFCGTKSFCRTKPQRNQLATRMAPSSWSCFCNVFRLMGLRQWMIINKFISLIFEIDLFLHSTHLPFNSFIFVFRFRYRQY